MCTLAPKNHPFTPVIWTSISMTNKLQVFITRPPPPNSSLVLIDSRLLHGFLDPLPIHYKASGGVCGEYR